MNSLTLTIVILQLYACTEGGLMSNVNDVGRCGDKGGGQTAVRDGVTYETVRYGHYIELDCCCRDCNDISWLKWTNESNKWQPFVPDRSEVKFLHKMHTLSIQSSIFEDSGLYKCDCHNSSGNPLATTFLLDVVACDKLARGPFPVPPFSCPETIARETETLTLQCAGYFGCREDGDIRIVTWFVSLDKNKNDKWIDAETVDKRYKQVGFHSDGFSVKGSNLSIKSVTAVDFNRKFMCLLASPQMEQGQTKLVVTLTPGTKERLVVSDAGSSYLITVSVISAVACISLIVNIVTLACRHHGGRKNKRKNIHRDIQGMDTCKKLTSVDMADFDT